MGELKDIQALYSSYKQCTGYVLQWLWSKCSPVSNTHLHVSFRSTKEILEAADQVRTQNCHVPRSVIQALKEAITIRWRVWEIYRSLSVFSDDQNASDERHRTFVMRLEDVLRILQPLERKVQPSRSKSPLSLESAGLESASNRFTALSDLDNLHEEGDNDTNWQKDPCVNAELNTSDPSLPHPPQDVLLEDDEIGEFIELSLYFYELDLICEQVDTYWREAAVQHISIPLAAFLSTTALYAVNRISKRVAAIAPKHSIRVTKWIVHKCRGIKLRFTDIPELKCRTGGRLSDGMSFHHIGQILEHCRTLEDYKEILPDAGKRQDPLKHIHRTVENNTDMDGTFSADDLALDMIQESMRQLLGSERAITGLEISQEDAHISEPLLPLMKQILSSNDVPIPTHLVFGMDMLLSTYKAFLWLDDKPNKRNCRIAALQLANEVLRSVTATASAIVGWGNHVDPVVTEQWLLLQVDAEALQKFAREQRFDLYYQAPWTAGCHMIEILDVAFTGGLNLCCSIGYVCAILHLYNALRRLDTPIESIPVLDQMCQVLLDPLFLGTLPKNNFSSHYRRAMGQRVSKNGVSGRNASVLSRATKTSLREGVGPSKLSIFYELHGSYYQPTIDYWVRIYKDPAIRKPRRAEKRDVMNSLHSEPFNMCLEKIKNRVLPEFNGELPVIRIDFFAIFRFCTQILLELGNVVERNMGTSAKCNGVALGFVWTDQILDSIVQHLNDDFKRIMMSYWRELNMTKTVFANVDRTKSVSEFLWSI